MDPYENLSEDNHVAFLQLEKEFRNELETAQEDQNSNWSYITADYMNKTLAAANALDVDALSGFPSTHATTTSIAKISTTSCALWTT